MAVAGWYADPYGAQGQLRYWDGAQWTANVMPRPASGPVQGVAGASNPMGAQAAQTAQAQAAQATQAAQTTQIPSRTMHESMPLGTGSTAASATSVYGYQNQTANQQQYAGQQANPYANTTQNQGYAQTTNPYEAAAQGYAQTAASYDAAGQGYTQTANAYDAAAQGYAAQGYGQYDPNAQAYGQMGASPYYQGYDPYQQMNPGQPVQAPEGSDRTLRLIAFVLSVVSIVGVVALVILVALSFFDVIDLGYGYGALSDLVIAGPVAFVVALPLAWTIPMCIHTLGILHGTKRNTVLFAVLMLLFCNLIAGVLLLVAKKDPKPLY